VKKTREVNLETRLLGLLEDENLVESEKRETIQVIRESLYLVKKKYKIYTGNIKTAKMDQKREEEIKSHQERAGVSFEQTTRDQKAIKNGRHRAITPPWF